MNDQKKRYGNRNTRREGGTEREPRCTTVADLRKYTEGSVVRLPDFAEGKPLVARLRRPGMLSLVSDGMIPNQLLVEANKLFANGIESMDKENPAMTKNVYDIFEVICRASMIEPTYDEVIDSGMRLTDEQMLAIFNYSQVGVKALRPFRV